MGLLSTVAAALVGRSTYQAPSDDVASRGAYLDIDSPQVDQIRRMMGGQLQPPPRTQTRWYMADLETAELAADNGNLEIAARLMRAVRRDGTLSGVLSTRTGGLVRLPKTFTGDTDVCQALELGHKSVRSVYDEMFPPTELALMAADGILLGVAVGELVPVEGRDYPVLVRLDPEFLYYRWSDNRWYFKSIGGLLPITPGDGRWILHTPGGRMVPWQHGQWRAIGRSYIRKEHAQLYKDSWEGKLANPARVAVSPQGGSEAQTEAWFQKVMAWGVNTVFGLKPGYDVKLLESNGRGWECFLRTIDQSNTEMIITIAGQTVTVDGGAGFQNSDIHKSIRADLIKETADGIAQTVNTQGIPVFVAARYGVDAVESRPCVVNYDVTPPKDRNAEAQSLVTAANAVKGLIEALTAAGATQQLDLLTLCRRFGIPLAEAPVRPALSLVTPTRDAEDDNADAEDAEFEEAA